MMDEPNQKIVDSAMALIRERGYAATTTKDIARNAGVHECTLFRKFKSKKNIVEKGIEQEKRKSHAPADLLQKVTWELYPDLEMFMNLLMERISPEFINLSMGLRSPQIYKDTLPFFQETQQSLLSILKSYLKAMKEKGKLGEANFECMAMTIYSSAFGYVYLNAAYGAPLAITAREEYIQKTVELLIEGMP